MKNTNQQLYIALKEDLTALMDKYTNFLFDSVSREIINNLLIIEMRSQLADSASKSPHSIKDEDVDELSHDIDQILSEGKTEINKITQKIVNSADQKIQDVYSG